MTVRRPDEDAPAGNDDRVRGPDDGNAIASCPQGPAVMRKLARLQSNIRDEAGSVVATAKTAW